MRISADPFSATPGLAKTVPYFFEKPPEDKGCRTSHYSAVEARLTDLIDNKGK
jgi:hypothetical protein